MKPIKAKETNIINETGLIGRDNLSNKRNGRCSQIKVSDGEDSYSSGTDQLMKKSAKEIVKFLKEIDGRQFLSEKSQDEQLELYGRIAKKYEARSFLFVIRDFFKKMLGAQTGKDHYIEAFNLLDKEIWSDSNLKDILLDKKLTLEEKAIELFDGYTKDFQLRCLDDPKLAMGGAEGVEEDFRALAKKLLLDPITRDELIKVLEKDLNDERLKKSIESSPVLTEMQAKAEQDLKETKTKYEQQARERGDNSEIITLSDNSEIITLSDNSEIITLRMIESKKEALENLPEQLEVLIQVRYSLLQKLITGITTNKKSLLP